MDPYTYCDAAFDLYWIYGAFMMGGQWEDSLIFQELLVRQFMLQMGLPNDAIDEGRRLWHEMSRADALGDHRDAIFRFGSWIGDDEHLQGSLISSLVALVQVRGSNLTDEQVAFISFLQQFFDMRPSRFQAAILNGMDRGENLSLLCSVHAASRKFTRGD